MLKSVFFKTLLFGFFLTITSLEAMSVSESCILRVSNEICTEDQKKIQICDILIEDLCKGAQSDAPVDCYHRAILEFSEIPKAAALLCQGAENTARVDCGIQLKSKFELLTGTVARLCAAD